MEELFINKRADTGNRRPVLNEKRVQIKDGEFVWYDSEAKQNVSLGDNLSGLFLGKCMKIETFDSRYGKNGGVFNSAYIFNYDNVLIFSPKGDKEFKGTYADALAFLGSKGNVKKSQVLFVLTVKGIFAISTNLVAAISQLNMYEQKLMHNTHVHFIELELQKYDPATSNVCNKAKKLFDNAVVRKNPPIFADISVGDPVKAEWANKVNAAEIIDLFISYETFYKKAKDVDSPDSTSELPAGLGVSKQEADDIEKKTDAHNKKSQNFVEDDGVDLPF